jgi:hypothetical protein
LDKSKKYAVGMNSYMYSTYKFAHEDDGIAMNVNTADILIKYIENKQIIDYRKTPAGISIKK